MNALKTGSRFHRNVARHLPEDSSHASGASKSHIKAMAEPDVRQYRAGELSGGRLKSVHGATAMERGEGRNK